MKRKSLILCILINLAGIMLIPLNLYLLNLPEYITVIAAILMVLSYGLFIRESRRLLPKILMGVGVLLCIAITLFGSYCNPYWNSVTFVLSNGLEYTKSSKDTLSYEKAKEDIDYFMHYLKKLHPVTKDDFPKEIIQSYNEVLITLENSDRIDITLLKQLIQEIASKLRDGHTYCFANYENIHYLKYTRLIRQGESRLLKVDGISIEDILMQKSDLYSYEVESWALFQLNNDLTTLEGLYYLGFDIEDGIEYTYETYENEKLVEHTVLYQASDFISYDEYLSFNNLTDVVTNDNQFVSYSIDTEKSLAVLTLTECNYNDEYKNCLRDMFKDVKRNNISNVAVDLRNNGGGNSMVANEFIRYLDIDTYKTGTYMWRFGKINIHFDKDTIKNNKNKDLLFDGDIYVLTSARSFSSAMLFACFIKDNGLGDIIGEAPGNTPTGYGEVALFKMPNSSLYTLISTKSFTRADRDTDDIVVYPDIPCDAKDTLEVLSQHIAGKEG